MSSKLAVALAEVIVKELYPSTCASTSRVKENAKRTVASVIDRRLIEVSQAYKPELLAECPVVTHHREDPCAFCITAAMRAFILPEEST